MAEKEPKKASGKKPKSVPTKPDGSGSLPKLPPVIGAMKSSQAAEKLAVLGDEETARLVRKSVEKAGKDQRFANLHWGWDRPDPIYKYTEHAFGFIGKDAQPIGTGKAAVIAITDAGNIDADGTLKGARIKLTLDRLRVYDYPGGGEHTVLFDFAGQHQTDVAAQSQDLHFAQHYRVKQGGGAGIRGYPVFVGLKVGKNGVAFKCSTVNVSNSDDQKLLQFLNADVFKKGLELIGTLNPAVPVVSGFATGILEAFARRNNNVRVQEFYMGLDFTGIRTGAQLREGSYIAVQVQDAAKWDWEDWVFKPSNGQIVSRSSPSEGMELNYVVFSVSRMEDD